MITRTLLVLFLVGTVSSSAQVSVGETPQPPKQTSSPIALSLGRKIRAGDKYLLSTGASYRLRIASEAPGMPTTDSTYQDTVRLHALCDVTAVTESGEEYEKTLTVRYFHRIVNDNTIDILPNGTQIKVVFSQPAVVFTVNGAKPAPELEEMLRLAVRSEGGSKSGDILNPNRPVQLGDIWSIDRKAFAKHMVGATGKNATKGISGEVRFDEVITINHRPCATVSATIHQKSGNGTMSEPEQTGKYDMKISVPLDERYPAMVSSVRARIRVSSRDKGIKLIRETEVAIDSRFDR